MATSYDDDIESSKKQRQTNADVADIKKHLYYTKEQTVGKDSPYSRIRSMGPGMAKQRLDDRGVDTDSLITGQLSENEGYKKGGKIKKYDRGGSTAGAGRGGQGGPTAAQMAERNSPNYMTPETERQLKAERDERLQQAKINEAYEAATQNIGKKKGGKITHYKSASAAVKAAEKRGDKSITVKFNHRDGIAQRGHTKGRMR